MNEAAKLPPEWIRPEQRTLAEMKNGEGGYVNFAELVVLPDRSCFLPRDVKLQETETAATISVRKDFDGKNHISIPAQSRFRFRTVKALRVPELFEPVASIAFEGEQQGIAP